MDINGCQIISAINAESPDGFAMTVIREQVEEFGDEREPKVTKVTRGPFRTILESIQYARLWNDIETPPAIQRYTNTTTVNKKKVKTHWVKIDVDSETVSTEVPDDDSESESEGSKKPTDSSDSPDVDDEQSHDPTATT